MSAHEPQLGVSLSQPGSLALLDRALETVRHGGGALLVRSFAGGAPLVLLGLAFYDLERIEGVHTLRAQFAFGFALAFLLRSLVASRVARGYALVVRPSLPLPPPSPAIDVIASAAVVGLGLSFWLWPLGLLARVSPLAVAAGLPLLALRGAVAPSWLARVSAAPERGFAALGQALDDTRGVRLRFAQLELATLCGALGLFANLYASFSALLVLGRSLLGLDVAFMTMFLSPENGYFSLLLGLLCFLLFEPLRASLSAQAFVEARTRRDGADLHAAIDRVIAEGAGRQRRRIAGAALGVLVCIVSWSTRTAHAEAPPAAAQAAERGAAVSSALEDGDDEVRERARRILGRAEFQEISERNSHAIQDLIDKLSAWLDRLETRRRDEREPDFHAGSVSTTYLFVALAIVLGAGLVWYARAQRTPGAPTPRAPQATSAETPATLLDRAAELATAGDPRLALRALYLALLTALDRAQRIEYDPSKTNWQYRDALPAGALREDFAAFTRIFDRVWYGREPVTQAEYETCRVLAQRICAKEPV